MTERSQKNPDIVDEIIPKEYTETIGSEDFIDNRDPKIYALSTVIEKWRKLFNNMNNGLKEWCNAVGISNASKNKAHYDIWYRGIKSNNPEYCLWPKAMRNLEGKRYSLSIERERTMFLDFERLSIGMHASHTPSYWSTYFLMQHYEMPTRLLDWTEAFLVALYFAIMNVKKTKKSEGDFATVLLLFPQLLNFLTTQPPKKGPKTPYNNYKFTVDSKLDCERGEKEKHPLEKYKIITWDNRKYPKLPAAMWPSYQDLRIKAQRSVFTIHAQRNDFVEAIENGKTYFLKHNGENSNGTESKKDIKLPLLGQIKISKNDKVVIEALKNQIIESGISKSTLFPDLQHLAEELTYDFNEGEKHKIPKWHSLPQSSCNHPK